MRNPVLMLLNEKFYFLGDYKIKLGIRVPSDSLNLVFSREHDAHVSNDDAHVHLDIVLQIVQVAHIFGAKDVFPRNLHVVSNIPFDVNDNSFQAVDDFFCFPDDLFCDQILKRHDETE